MHVQSIERVESVHECTTFHHEMRALTKRTGLPYDCFACSFSTDMDLVKAEEERLRRQKANEDLPPLPPLLAQILAETRAKQAAKKAAQEKGETTGEENAQAAGDEEAKPQTGPLLLEAPPSGLVMQGTNVAPQKEQRDSDDSDAEGEPDQPPGPLDASRCGVHGPGFSGAAAGQTVKLTITARDSAGKRIREGGAHILVMVEPPSAPGAEEEPDAIQADVVDHGNGTYTASYSVPTKGNYQVGGWAGAAGCRASGLHAPGYRWLPANGHTASMVDFSTPPAPPLQLHIEVNGDPLGDSPYPLFFSAPVPQPEAAAGVDPQLPAVPGALQPGAAAAMPGMSMPMPALGAGGLPIVTAESIKAAQQQAAAGGAGGAAMTAAFPNLATGVQISLGCLLLVPAA
jgi:arginine/serine-rich splicing factor 12